MAKTAPAPKLTLAQLVAKFNALVNTVEDVLAFIKKIRPLLDLITMTEGIVKIHRLELDQFHARLQAVEAATGVNPPATGKTVERSILARLDTIERFMTESRP